MRIRAFAVAASLALITLPAISSDASAQIGRRPRPAGGQGGRGADPLNPAGVPLPQEAPPVSHALSYVRSRWAFESYALLNSVQMPAGNGVITTQSFGAGTHGDYRLTDNFSFTVDATTSSISNPSNNATVELGSRYALLPLERTVRPFVDVRGAYLRTYDLFSTPGQVISAFNNSDVGEVSRYGHGYGAAGGAGLDIALTHSVALTTEFLALRSRVTVGNSTSITAIPVGSHFWTTTARYIIGLRFSPVRVAHLAQNPKS